jgi:hypothetical protein
MYTYDTVSQAVNGLKQRGFNYDFNFDSDVIICKEASITLRPSEFEITEVYRYEGDSDPADEAVVYAIESKQGHKGILVNGYGISTDAISDDLVKKLKVVH